MRLWEGEVGGGETRQYNGGEQELAGEARDEQNGREELLSE